MAHPNAQHRNNAIHFRALLIRACVVMERYDPSIMPNDLKVWWAANRPAAKARPQTSQGEIDMAAVARIMAEYSDLPDVEKW